LDSYLKTDHFIQYGKQTARNSKTNSYQEGLAKGKEEAAALLAKAREEADAIVK
jgi:hypothetical protein